MRAKIRLETYEDIQKFIRIVEGVDGKVEVVDGNGLRINGQSVIGLLSKLDFNELWCESDKDIWMEIRDFVVIEPERKEGEFHE